MKQQLTQSQEDYLEVIHDIASQGESVCVSEIAQRKKISKPSVTNALRRLEKYGFIRHGKYDYVELTKAGEEKAKGLASKHAVLKKFLTDVLSVPPRVADADACVIEHCVSDVTIKAVINFFK